MIDPAPLINLGAVGAVLAWFIFRAENSFARMERAINRLARAVTLMAIAANHGAAKREADAILGELDHAEPRPGTDAT